MAVPERAGGVLAEEPVVEAILGVGKRLLKTGALPRRPPALGVEVFVLRSGGAPLAAEAEDLGALRIWPVVVGTGLAFRGLASGARAFTRCSRKPDAHTSATP